MTDLAPHPDEAWYRAAIRAAACPAALVVEPIWHGDELAALLASRVDSWGPLLRAPSLRAWVPSDGSRAARAVGLAAVAGIPRERIEQDAAAVCWESALVWAVDFPVVAAVLSRHAEALGDLAGRSGRRLGWTSRPKVDIHEAADALARRDVSPFSDLPDLGLWRIAALGGAHRPRHSGPVPRLSGSIAAWRVLVPALGRVEMEARAAGHSTLLLHEDERR